VVDDIEGDGGQEGPADTGPSSEPASDVASELTSEIRRSIDTQRERGPDGKFVKTDGKPGPGSAQGIPAKAAKGVATGGAPIEAETGAGNPTLLRDAPGVRPPPGFSVAAKQAWDALPEAVKADIAKRESDFEVGLKRYTGLANFAETAERNGTTLQNAVSDYVAIEEELRKDPVNGVEFLFRRMGLNPLQVLKGWLSRYVPAQGSNGQATQNPGPQYAPPVDPREIVAQATQAVRSEFQMREINNDIAKFSANPANKFFDNVRPAMARLVAADDSLNLQTAYEAACWMHPQIRAVLLEEAKSGQGAQRTAQRAQNAAKAVTGAPSSNSHAGEPPRRKDLSLDEEIRANVAAQKGAA
jgi:hypothetical protein